jgi:hypothetical protein
MKNKDFTKTIRWTARIIGALLALFCLMFFIGYSMEGSGNSKSGLEPYNYFVFAFWGIGLAALILAWWKEGLGGIISLISFIIFNILAALSPVKGAGYSIILLIFLIPSVLFIYSWKQAMKMNN